MMSPVRSALFGLSFSMIVTASVALGAPPSHAPPRAASGERSKTPIVLGALVGLVVVGGILFAALRRRPTSVGLLAPAGNEGAPRGVEPTAAAVESPWKQELALAQKAPGFDWDNDSLPGRALVNRLLTRAAPVFGDGQVKELPDDERIELRGTYGGSPIRFSVWMAFGSFRAIEMHCENRVGALMIERDPEKQPKTHDPSDPWSKNETRREFLRDGIFVEGTNDLAASMAVWGKLPATTQSSVLDAMNRLDMRSVLLRDTVSLNVTPRLRDLDDPLAYMESCARVLEELKNAVAQGADKLVAAGANVHIGGNVIINGVRFDPARGAAAAPHTCAFCSSLFVLDESHGACPSCGAQASTPA